MARDDWYRNTDWSPAIEKYFFEKLACAKSQKYQYLVLQAGALSQSHPKVALRLVAQYFETRPDQQTAFIDDNRALGVKAAASIAMRDLSAALNAYRAILELERVKPSFKSTAFLDYPFLVASAHISDEYEAALAVLEERKGDVAFPAGRYRWNASYALILADLGKASEASSYASAALAAAAETRSEFLNHPRVGLVMSSDDNTYNELQKLCV